MNILCIGKSKIDIELNIDKNNRINQRVEHLIGCSLVVSYLLGSFDEDVYFQSIIGDDVYGKKIIGELKSVNVNTEYIEEDKTLDTTVMYRIVNSNEKEELVESELFKRELSDSYNFKPDLIFSDLSELKFTKTIFSKYPAIKVSVVKEFNNDVPNICKNSDYMVLTLPVCEKITSMNVDLNNTNSLIPIYNKLESFYDGDIIIDLGNMGTLYKIDNNVKLMGKIKSNYELQNRNVFYGSIVYGIIHKLNIEKCVKIATIAEYLSTKNSNKSIYIPKLEEIYELYKKNK